MHQDRSISHFRRELDRMFPITDIPSARLMKVKARCVFDSGSITATELAEIERRANAAIRRATEQTDAAA